MILRDERAGIVTGWLFKIILGLALLALTVFETGSIILARVTVDRIAIEAASEAGLEYGRTSSSSKTQDVAERIAARQDARVVGKVEIFRDLEQIRVTVKKEAKTLILGKIGWFDRFTESSATHSARIR
jgi:hypothetical protein